MLLRNFKKITFSDFSEIVGFWQNSVKFVKFGGFQKSLKIHEFAFFRFFVSFLFLENDDFCKIPYFVRKNLTFLGSFFDPENVKKTC